MTTARRRARATLALFSPRRRATRIAHALSVDLSAEHDHARPAQAPGLSALLARQPRGPGPAAEQGLGPADLDRALARLERTEGTTIRTIVGINRTACSVPAARAGDRTCPTSLTSPSSRCSGSRSTSCSAGCPRAARAVRQGRHPAGRGPGWSHGLPDGELRAHLGTTALCPLRRRGLAPGGDLLVVAWRLPTTPQRPAKI